MNDLLKIGQEVPNFSLKDSEGDTVTKDDLLGAPFILYFYPKDNTPGCTKEACQFRDLIDAFEEMNFLVVGVSPDGEASHQKFIREHELTFPLLCDTQFDLAGKCGVVKTTDEGKKGIIRSTFIFDEEGVVQWIESPVNVEGHAERVMRAAEDAFA
jgi:peroxiredoxin Q/BCP